MTPLSDKILNSIHGYFTVGEEVYLNKMQALDRATKTHKSVQWHLYDHAYSKIDWTIRPGGTLEQAYKERAQQIRDEYDYVVVHFSGGMDSWTALHSFLANGIRVDEIYTRWARAERKFQDATILNRDERNVGSEFEYAVLPVLEQIKKDYPEINIVIDDYSEDYGKEKTDSSILDSHHWQAMSTTFRVDRKSEFERKAAKANKKVGIVYGADKICSLIDNGNFYAYFVDGYISGTDADPDRTFELFYWSPKAPHIPVLQAHCIKDFIVAGGDNLCNIGYRKIYLQSCYANSNYNPDTFQTNKALGSLISRSEIWVMKYNRRFYESWKWANLPYFNSIDQTFVSKFQNTDLTVGLKKGNSQFYLIESGVPLQDTNFGLKAMLTPFKK